MARRQCDTHLVRVSFCFQKPSFLLSNDVLVNFTNKQPTALHTVFYAIELFCKNLHNIWHFELECLTWSNILCHFDNTKNYLFPKHVISKEVEKLPQVWSKHCLQKTLIRGKLKLKACMLAETWIPTTIQDFTGTNSAQGVTYELLTDTFTVQKNYSGFCMQQCRSGERGVEVWRDCRRPRIVIIIQPSALNQILLHCFHWVRLMRDHANLTMRVCNNKVV
jgi:hypothetical protein